MKFMRETLGADGLLLLTAIIWGFAFVAQRSGMDHIGPFAFSAARFALGALSLLPVLFFQKKGEGAKGGKVHALRPRQRVLWSAAAGAVLFLAASLQQVGLAWGSTAGNAGFVTCLYVVLVPMAGFFLGRTAGLRIWIGAALALAGLYILCIGTGFVLAPGDLLEFVGAFFWAGHILLIGHIGSRMDTLELCIGQFTVCSFLSLATAAAIREPNAVAGLLPAAIPILYGGILSTCVAYTLQIIGQRKAHPAHASIIFSMESLFAAVGGVLLLHEPVTARLLVGGILMLAGMICSQMESGKAAA